ncbi:MAG: rhomboid family intramembrane serine protease [Verrucomicrobiales bacterium]|nr:rhomboid family intramembrane serine protease [Verrucomicrobiales bacterium]MCP5557210.1 rhomboid family intramembrane serine protease [Verrucomicrobiaceae bacterium]
MIPLRDDSPTHRFPIMTVAIIIVNAAVYFLWQSQIGLEESVSLAAFVPDEFTTALARSRPAPWRDLFTSMFMHGGLMHLVGNLWFLWIFGDNVESECGSLRYVMFYLLCGVAATLAHVWGDPHSPVPLVGASGAISGVLGAYLVQHPKAQVWTLIPMGFFTRIVDIPAFVFLFIWIGLQIFSQVASGPSGGGGVAYLAHIAGFVAGMVLIFVFRAGRSEQVWVEQ